MGSESVRGTQGLYLRTPLSDEKVSILNKTIQKNAQTQYQKALEQASSARETANATSRSSQRKALYQLENALGTLKLLENTGYAGTSASKLETEYQSAMGSYYEDAAKRLRQRAISEALTENHQRIRESRAVDVGEQRKQATESFSVAAKRMNRAKTALDNYQSQVERGTRLYDKTKASELKTELEEATKAYQAAYKARDSVDKTYYSQQSTEALQSELKTLSKFGISFDREKLQREREQMSDISAELSSRELSAFEKSVERNADFTQYATVDNWTSTVRDTERKKYGTTQYVSAAAQQKYLSTGQWTDEEKAVYNYIYAKNGADAAKAYEKQLKAVRLNERSAEALSAHQQKAARENKVLATAGSYGANLSGTVSYPMQIGEGIINALKGKGFTIDQNAPYNAASREVTDVRSAVKEDWGAGGQLLYDALNSTIDSALNILIANAAVPAAEFAGLSEAAQGLALKKREKTVASTVSAVMGSQVAGQRVIEGLNNGETPMQATLNGFIQGAIEGITEEYSVEKILSNANSGILKRWAMNGLTEGTEEVASNVLNRITDGLMNKDEAELKAEYLSYLAQGLSRDAALGKVFSGMLAEDAESFFAGALSGVAMGAVTATEEKSSRNKAVAELSRELADMGEKNGDKLAAAIIKASEGRTLTVTEAATLSGSKYGEAVLRKMTEQDAESGVKSGETAIAGNGGLNDGSIVSDGGIQRGEGNGSGVEAGGMVEAASGAEGAGGAGRSSRLVAGGTESERSNSAAAIRPQIESAAANGIERGSEEATSRFLPVYGEDERVDALIDGDKELSAIQKDADACGFTVHYVSGEFKTDTGAYAAGYTDRNGDIWLCIDARNETATELYEHEKVHNAVGDDAKTMRELIDALQTTIPEAELSAMVDKKIEAYKGVVTAEEQKIIYEEIAADAFGRKGDFRDNYAETTEEVRRVVEQRTGLKPIESGTEAAESTTAQVSAGSVLSEGTREKSTDAGGGTSPATEGDMTSTAEGREKAEEEGDAEKAEGVLHSTNPGLTTRAEREQGAKKTAKETEKKAEASEKKVQGLRTSTPGLTTREERESAEREKKTAEKKKAGETKKTVETTDEKETGEAKTFEEAEKELSDKILKLAPTFVRSEELTRYEIMDIIEILAEFVEDGAFTSEEALRAIERIYKSGGIVSVKKVVAQLGTKAGMFGFKAAAKKGGSFSISETEDGQKVAVVENDILRDIYTEDWDEQTRKLAKKEAYKELKKFNGVVVVNGNNVKINRAARKHYIGSKNTEWLMKADDKTFADKMRTADVMDDVLYVTTNWKRDNELKHNRTDDLVDFIHGDALIMSGEAKYKADVVIGVDKNGEYRLHDVDDLTPERFEIKEKTEPIPSAIAQNEPRRNRTSVYEGNVPQTSVNVKGSFSISSETDKKYMDAVNAGDMRTAQRMVDEAAENAMKNSTVRDESGKLLPVYHGGTKNYTVFDRTKGRSTMDIQGTFFSPWEEEAQGYGENVRRFYLNLENPATEGQGYKALNRFKGQNHAGVKAREYLESMGFDGVGKGEGTEEYIVFDPERIKSADAVTYDDSGKVIPLSERFNIGSRDIRFSISEAPVITPDMDYEEGIVSRREYVSEMMADALRPVMEYDGKETPSEDYISSLLEDPTKKRPSKAAAVRYAEKIGMPLIDGERAVPYWTWVRAKDRGNYGLVIGPGVGMDSVNVLFWNRKGSREATQRNGKDTYLEYVAQFYPEELEAVPGERSKDAEDIRSMMDFVPEERETVYETEESPFTDADYLRWEREAEQAKETRRLKEREAYDAAREILDEDTPANLAEEDPETLAAVIDAGDSDADIEDVDIGDPEEIQKMAVLIRPGRGGKYTLDISRNLDAAAGKDKEVRRWLKRWIEDPIFRAKDAYSRGVERHVNDLYAVVVKKYGIKKGSKESAAVQWYGEGQKQGEYSGLPASETKEYSLSDLKREFPQKWKDIVAAEKYIREQYDEYIKRINQSREKIYPRAMEKAKEAAAKLDATARYYERAVKRQSEVVAKIRQTMEERKEELGTKKPGTQVYANLQNSIEYNERRLDAARRKADRYQEKAERVNSAAANIKNAIESGDVLKNHRLQKRKDYFHHFQEMSQGLEALKNIITTPTDIDSTLSYMSEFTNPKSKWAGIFQRRYGAVMDADAVGGMLAYIPTAEYAINIDPVIARGRAQIQALAKATKLSRNANKFLTWYGDYINDIAGKTNYLDRAVQKMVGRKTMAGLRWLNSRVRANAVMGNMRSAVSQFFNLPNAAAYIKNPGDWLKGMWLIFDASVLGDKTAKEVMKRSAFMRERYLDDIYSKFDKGILSTPKKIAGWMMEAGDKISANVMWAAAYEQGVRTKKADPIGYADDITRRSTAGRGIGETALIQKSEVFKLIAPFQVEVNNTFQLLKEKVGEKDALGIILMLLLSWGMNSIPRELFGFDVGFDPINDVIESMRDIRETEAENEAKGEDADKYTALDKIMDVVGRLAGDVIGQAPMGAQLVKWAIKDDDKRKALFGEGDPTRFGTGNIGLTMLLAPVVDFLTGDEMANDLISAVLNIAMPYGGKATERIIEALQQYGWLPTVQLNEKDGLKLYFQRGGGASYTDSGRLRFASDPSAGEVIKTVMFGTFGSKAGMTYIEEDGTPLSEERTELFRKLTEAGMNTVAAYDALATVFDIQGDKDENGNTVDGSREYNLIQWLGTINEEDEVKRLLFLAKASEGRTEDVEAMESAGMTFREILDTVSAYLEYSMDGDMTGVERDAAFKTYLSNHIEDEQKAVVLANMGYSTGMKAVAEVYDKLYDVLGDANEAQAIFSAWKDLKPEEGKASVSDGQKIAAVLESGLSDVKKEDAIGVVLGTETMTETGGQTAYGKMQTLIENGTSLKEWYDLYQNGNTDRAITYQEAGLSASSAVKVATAIGDLEPAEGKSTVTEIQRITAAVNAVPESEKDTAVKMFLEEGTPTIKYEVARKYGISADTWVKFKNEVLKWYNYDTSGSANNLSNVELTACLKNMNMTLVERAILWQISTNSKGTSNPFSTGYGNSVYYAVQEAK